MRNLIQIFCISAGCNNLPEVAVKLSIALVLNTLVVVGKAALATATIIYVARYLKVFWI